MDERQKHLSKLDEAVDRMDLEAVNTLLDCLDELEMEKIVPEEPALFAARIRGLQKKRESIMKHKNTKVILIAACLAAALSVGVYATGAWTHFSFFSDGRAVTVATGDGSMTETQARELARETEIESVSPEDNRVVKLPPPETFASAEEAAQKLQMPVAIPGEAKNMALQEASGQVQEWCKTLWLTYGEEGHRLAVTIEQALPVDEDTTVVSYSDIQGENRGTYRNAKGDSFTMIRDEHGDYALAQAGDYQYVVIFENFTEQDIHSVLESVDLSVYK